MSSAGAQVPGPGRIVLDHVGLFAPDLAEAGRVFERLGFVLTPETVHEHRAADGSRARSGTANRCAILADGYLEFLAAVDGLDTLIAAELRTALARYSGIHLIAFGCADPGRESERLARIGFAPQPVVHLRRPVEAAEGGPVEAAFSVIRLPPGTMPEGRVQMLRHETPEAVWRPGLAACGNAAAALSGVVSCTIDPEEAAARFARFCGKPAAGRRIGLDRGQVDFVDPSTLARLLPGARPPSLPFNAAVVLESSDIARTRDFLLGRGVPILGLGEGVVAVPPEDALGAWIVFRAAAAPWPGPDAPDP